MNHLTPETEQREYAGEFDEIAYEMIPGRADEFWEELRDDYEE